MARPFPKTKGFLCYVDESGCEGFRFGRGSSDWFILAGVLTRQSFDDHVTSVVDEVKREIDWPAERPLHWRKLHHLEKRLFADRIASRQCRLVVVAVRKPSLVDRENFQERYRLYFWGVRRLLERVSWAVRDAHRMHAEGDGRVGAVFSNRAEMSYDEMRSYLAKLRRMSDSGHDVRIDWTHFDPGDLRAFPAGHLRGLQIADAVAGAFYNALETTKTSGQKTDYAEILVPRLYKYKGKVWGNGLKVEPREAVALVDGTEELAWCRALKEKR